MDYKRLREKKIGYIPVSKGLSSAGDRRRFIYYANYHNLKWEYAKLDTYYDIVYITTMANITDWIVYKQKNSSTVLIFDINNSFFFKTSVFWNLARGVSRYISGRETKLYLNYNSVYRKMFRQADIIVCPTKNAKKYILNYNDRVHLSFDYFEDDISNRKSAYNQNQPLILVWEGMGVTAKHLLIISPVLEKFKGRVKLRIISDRYYKLGGLFQKNVLDIFSNAKFDFEFYDWEKETFSSLIAESDIAVIPLDTSDKLALDKPENKLILFWQHGMPTMTSDIPTYRDAFSKIDLDLTCNNSDQWEKKIEFFLSGKFDYNQHMNSVNKYIDHFRSQKQFIKAWNNIFIDALKLSDRNN